MPAAPKPGKKKINYIPIRKLKDLAWKNFSKYIRAVRDEGVCYTCGSVQKWQDTQCGHYESRKQSGSFLDERNNHCQCVKCNCWKDGNSNVYARNLIRDYGPHILNELAELNIKPLKHTHAEWVSIIMYYEAILELKGIKPAPRPKPLTIE